MNHAADGGDGKTRSGEWIGFGFFLMALAVAFNFVLDGMTDDDVNASLPWYIAGAYNAGGKLGVTLLLCSVGVLCIAWGMVKGWGRGDDSDPAPRSRRAPTRAGATPAKTHGPATNPARRALSLVAGVAEGQDAEEVRGEGEPCEEELEVGEAIPEEVAAARPGFAGGAAAGPTRDANPIPASAAPPGVTGGVVELATAKYLKTAGPEPGGPQVGPGGPGNFRRGRTHHTRTEG